MCNLKVDFAYIQCYNRWSYETEEREWLKQYSIKIK